MANGSVTRWRKYVEAAERSGLSLSAYARKHGLPVHSLYGARSAMRSSGGVSGGGTVNGKSAPRAARVAAFVPAGLVSVAGAAWSVRLTNGVTVELRVTGDSEGAALLGLLSALPCSV